MMHKSSLFVLAIFAACSSEAPKKEAMPTATEAPKQEAAIHFDNTKDPICDMDVKPSFTDTAHYQGKVFGFCSESCKETFKEAPAKYASATK